jgi:hypothetical protein
MWVSPITRERAKRILASFEERARNDWAHGASSNVIAHMLPHEIMEVRQFWLTHGSGTSSFNSTVREIARGKYIDPE